MRTTVTLLVTFACIATSDLFADNWPHWRGDSGNGVSLDATPPIEWSESKNVKWKVPIPGRGSGSPIIWEDRVYVATAVPTGDAPRAAAEPATPGVFAQQRRRRGGRRPGGGAERLVPLQFKLLCFDRDTGDLLWERTAVEATPHQGTHSTNGFASASPCTDGKHVYAHFGSRGLYCYTMDGDLKWKRDDLGRMETRNGFGEGSSPTLVEDKIIVPWDHEGQSYLFALDKRSGETIWRVERDEPSCWATPLVIEHKGRRQIIMNGEVCARAYDLETGKELWRCTGQTARPVASPVAANGRVFIGSGFRGSFLGAFLPDGQGDIEGTDHVAWTIRRDAPDIASLLLSEDRLYFYKARAGILSCVNASTGEPYFAATRISGLGDIYASPIAAGGHVYLTDRSGTTVVIRDAKQLEIVATNSVGETVDATPAPVDDELFIRGEKHLFCIAR
ncbi:outer membrane biogenesis protein BamB [Maioricimonas rarisocia]|uniref:Outer membrane biogenesis protein BamB n=1 Tax=Maioricimonas rarisocia TaxID=2528026 RepID=A0A517ZDG8_9PLAN|nr:PQQ-binding-like beta-propeller repeat protein [Maioricimonas rarisocia]QDU40480.1 outer membrane biogenesis protein BamB [Maioricimonas rarisocia]